MEDYLIYDVLINRELTRVKRGFENLRFSIKECYSNKYLVGLPRGSLNNRIP